MLKTHIYLNGDCKRAIEMYEEAFDATLETLIVDSNNRYVIHSEILIDNQLLILNDFGNNDGESKSGGYQLCVQFKSETDLKKAYEIMRNDSVTIDEMQATDYSSCTVRFIDKFGVRWGFML